MNYYRLFVGMFVLSVAIITWDEIREQKRVPLPKRYVNAGGVYMILGGFALLGAAQLAAVFGIGVNLALLYAFSKDAAIEKISPAPPETVSQPQATFEQI